MCIYVYIYIYREREREVVYLYNEKYGWMGWQVIKTIKLTMNESICEVIDLTV